MKVYAHRGYSGRYPENTMLAFKEAEKTGCYGIELDVQLTKDGEVVIIHDERVDRTTDGTGWVRDFTLEELKKLNAAAVWNGKYGFEPIPTLEEYCRWVKDTNMVTNIEIKSGVYYYEELEEKTLAPEIPCGALVEYDDLGNPGYYCEKFDFQYYHPGVKALTEEMVKSCREHGIPLNVWTINDMGALEQMYEWGVEGVISNYPGVCKGWIDSKK